MTAPGTLAQEAALLLDALGDRLSAMRADVATRAAADQPAACTECGSVPGASCTGCPVCRLIAVVKGERPDDALRLLDGTLAVVQGLRGLIGDGPAGPADSGDDAGLPPVEPIEVR